MKILKRDGNRQLTKLEKRVASIPTHDLVSWAENALFEIGKGLTRSIHDKDPDVLAEMELGAEALLAITKEIRKRS
jgi:hypothetical protein